MRSKPFVRVSCTVHSAHHLVSCSRCIINHTIKFTNAGQANLAAAAAAIFS